MSTSYVRAGTGAPVLLLGGDGRAGATASPLFAELSRRFRVIEPELVSPRATADGDGGDAQGPEAVAFSAWLRGFLDGLGVTRASVVADESLAARLLSYALAEPGRVDRLVLLYRDAEDPQLSPVAGADRLGQSGHPLLVLRVASCGAGPPPGAVAEVVGFLAAQSGAAA